MSSSITVTPLSGFDRNKPKTFETTSVMLGSDAGSDVRFDPTWDKTVSGSHARIVLENGGCWLIDANSRDGSLIGGEKVERREISSGTVIELGKGGPKLRVEFSGVPDSAPSPDAAFAPTAAADPAPQAAQAVAPSNNNSGMLVGGAVAIILVAAGIGWYLIYGGGDPAEKLAEVADEKQAAMGVLTFRDSSSEDDKLQGNGTAWAIAPRVFVTNAALVWSASEMMNMSVDIFIVVKGENGAEQLRVTGSRQHPRDLSSIMSGRDSLPIAAPFDIGLLLVERDAPAWFEIAGESDLLAMEADMPIGFMAHTRTVSLTDPRPRSGSGKIVALTNYWGEASDASERYVIEYDLPVIPEMSGGPIFNVDGEVVGLLTIPMISNPDPSPNESPKYYGQRIDLLKEVWSDYPRD